MESSVDNQDKDDSSSNRLSRTLCRQTTPNGACMSKAKMPGQIRGEKVRKNTRVWCAWPTREEVGIAFPIASRRLDWRSFTTLMEKNERKHIFTWKLERQYSDFELPHSYSYLSGITIKLRIKSLFSPDQIQFIIIFFNERKKEHLYWLMEGKGKSV